MRRRSILQGQEHKAGDVAVSRDKRGKSHVTNQTGKITNLKQWHRRDPAFTQPLHSILLLTNEHSDQRFSFTSHDLRGEAETLERPARFKLHMVAEAFLWQREEGKEDMLVTELSAKNPSVPPSIHCCTLSSPEQMLCLSPAALCLQPQLSATPGLRTPNQPAKTLLIQRKLLKNCMWPRNNQLCHNITLLPHGNYSGLNIFAEKWGGGF